MMAFAFPSLVCADKKVKEAPIPDFLRGDKIPEGYKHDWTLGPTGARGWMYSNKLETTQARQILVTTVENGSPSANVLQVGDVILGVGKDLFKSDPRTELGKAITEAESSDGKLQLQCWRKGKTKTKTIRLQKLGTYSKTAPFDCKKSKRIFEQGCIALAKRIEGGKTLRSPLQRSIATLALLSSGQREFLPIIQKEVKRASRYSDIAGRNLCSWNYGPVNILLAEYTLATGDKTYLADMHRISLEIVEGQSNVGSWGHRFAQPSGRLKGYGMMNMPGLPLTVSLVLARKAGVNDPKVDEAIEKSVNLLRFYSGKGCLPYGDHAPWIETHDDNGKNGVAALLFNLLDDKEAAEYYSRMSVACHSGERERGHTGNFFNILWAMPGVALSGPNASGAWMEEFGWYYDLARRWDGSFIHQGPAQPQNDKYHNWDSTGAYLLAYGQSLQTLYITGKKEGLVPKLSRDEAQQVVADGRGYSSRRKASIYADKSDKELLEMLSNWSPIVRNRAATAISKRDTDMRAKIYKLLGKDVYSQLGACEAFEQLGAASAGAVPKLRKTLKSKDLWVRVQAAEALAAIGPEARVAVPELLRMLQREPGKLDPRKMEQRFLSMALFDKKKGLLRKSLEGVDPQELYGAVRAGLQNDDSLARAAYESVFKRLSYEEIQPILPAIHQAILEPAPSGVMFSAGVRLAGLDLYAKHRIEEGMELCFLVMELDQWNVGARATRCLKTLQKYRGAAKPVLPKLVELKKFYESKTKLGDRDKKLLALVKQTMDVIKSDRNPPQLRSLQQSL